MSVPPTLGNCISYRRRQLRLPQTEAARRAGVSRMAWVRWEKDRIPEKSYWDVIEVVCCWAPGSVAAVLAGQPPVVVDSGLASVTPLHPDVHDPPDDLVQIWRGEMRLSEKLIKELSDEYRAEAAGEAVERRRRFEERGRAASG